MTVAVPSRYRVAIRPLSTEIPMTCAGDLDRRLQLHGSRLPEDATRELQTSTRVASHLGRVMTKS